MQFSDKKIDTGSGHPPFGAPGGGGVPHMSSQPVGGGAAGGGPRPPFPFAFPPPPDVSDLVPVVIPPVSEEEEQVTTTTTLAFIFLPGAFMYPSKDYAALTTELKNAFKKVSTDANIAVWLVMAAIDWSKMNPMSPSSTRVLFNQSIEQALQAAEDAGFTKNSSNSPSGRLDNVFIGMHSMSVLAAAGFPFHRAAGVVLLGASMVPTDSFWPSIHTYPRPILHIFGEMDGQSHQCRAALSAAEAALSAPSLGRKTTARESPIALIQGMNHAHFSNCKINYIRGDLDPETEQKNALEEVAAVVSAFLTAHSPAPLEVVSQNEEESVGLKKFQKAKKAAVDVLDDITMRAARHFTPYLRALGRTSAEDLLSCSEGACDTSPCYGEDLAQPVAYGHGAEYIWFDSPYCAFSAHPGELHTAERFAIRAQKQLLEAALPSDIVAGIPVAAVAHTSKESFTYSQPVILQCEDAPHGLVVKIHVLLQREGYPEGGSAATRAPTAALSPMYALKLKSGEQIAYAVHEMSSVLAEKQPPQQLRAGAGSNSGVAARLSAEVYEEALVLVGARAREIFQKRGYELIFKEDIRGGRPHDFNFDNGNSSKSSEGEGAQHGQQEPFGEKASDWIDSPLLLEPSSSSATSTTSVTGQEQKEEYSYSASSSVSDMSSTVRAMERMCTAAVPAVYIDAKAQGPFDEGPSRFAGAVYFKVPSLAWCMEWILVAGLRKK